MKRSPPETLVGLPIVITGASSGIGRATALLCAKAGMPVALGARRRDRLDSLIQEISAAGDGRGRAVALLTNVDSPEDCRRLVDLAATEFGPVYAVFANAGYGLHKPTHQTTDAELRAIFETNFFGSMNIVRPALERMLAGAEGGGTRGHIIFCSSCLSKVGTPLHGPYSATKACQDHIARAMRIELAPRGIAVSSVHPIGTRTEFFERAEANSRAVSDVLPGPPDLFTQPPERIARAVVRALRRGRGGEIWTSTPARIAFALADLFPRTTDRIMAAGVKRMLGREA
jgi:NAD(P)-dependent dehydrogenase (short-subunit alcohol dehydrogenase family)